MRAAAIVILHSNDSTERTGKGTKNCRNRRRTVIQESRERSAIEGVSAEDEFARMTEDSPNQATSDRDVFLSYASQDVAVAPPHVGNEIERASSKRTLSIFTQRSSATRVSE